MKIDFDYLSPDIRTLRYAISGLLCDSFTIQDMTEEELDIIWEEGNDSNQVICIFREDKRHRPRKRLPIQGGAYGNGDAFRHPLPRGIAKVE